MNYRIGTRGSKLALAQAGAVRDRLQKAYPFDSFSLCVIQTKGDRMPHTPLHEMGDKGVFVREIEKKLLSGEIQLAVHSMKDMPAHPAAGLMFAKAWKREDPRDALILREAASLADLPQGAVIGTGSARRKWQLLRLRPDFNVVGIRGNVETRLRKMKEEGLDGIVLAAAGLHRLGMRDVITAYLDAEEMLPAPAQGILALELLEGNAAFLSMLNALSDARAQKEAEAERGFLQEIGGGCHQPVGALCRPDVSGGLRLDVMHANAAGTSMAYATVCGREPKELARQAAASVRRQIAGTVALVGAGPGDPELITVKGLSAVRSADCIVYDRLAAPELLREAKSGCEKIYAGKERHNHAMTQEAIQRLLLEKSMEHALVVRLKGGDAYVFGRGGEEGLFLSGKGVPFTVIPGVSSCIAALTSAGIPVTHRGIAAGFHVVTAHDKSDAFADLDFAAMARGNETCIFLMGLQSVSEIARGLLRAGMPKETKAAVISNATRPGQRVCAANLEEISAAVQREGLASPAVFVVGDVVSLRERLYDGRYLPLSGKRFLIPKIGEAQTKAGQLLSAQGAAVEEVQVGVIAGTGRRFTAEALRDVDWLVFTSQNGVFEFFKSLLESGLDLRSLAGRQIAAVGEKTKAALRSCGVCADLVSEKACGQALAEALKKRLSSSERIWHLTAKHADGHLKEALRGFCRFEEIDVYENRAVEIQKECLRSYAGYDGVLFSCASSAKRLMDAMGASFGSCRVYSIGPATTKCLRRRGVLDVQEAEAASHEALVRLCMR